MGYVKKRPFVEKRGIRGAEAHREVREGVSRSGGSSYTKKRMRGRPVLLVLICTRCLRALLFPACAHKRLVVRSAALAALEGDILKRALSADGTVSAKVVDCSSAVREICELQECLPLAATALGRALTCVLLIADGIEDEETFQVQFDGDGPLRGVFALANGRHQARGYVGNPRLSLGTDASVKMGVGSGKLKVVRLKNLPGEDYARPFSSIVDLVSGEIAEDINHYIATSEQREGALAAGVSLDGNTVAAAAGWRVELLPGATDEVAAQVINNVKAILASTNSTADAFRYNQLSCDDLLGKLLDGLEPSVLPDTAQPSFNCECSVARVYRTLALLPRHEVDRIIQENSVIEAKCEFCARLYSLSPDDITRHLRKVDQGEIVHE